MAINPWEEAYINEKKKKSKSLYSDRFLAQRRNVEEEKQKPPDTEPSARHYEERYSRPKRPAVHEGPPRPERKMAKPQYLPRLSKKAEKQLSSNFKELSMVDGNILGLKKDAKTIYITSCFDGEGKTISAINIAYGLSVYAGRNVLLVDGNLNAPQIHRLFNVDIYPGLRDILYSNIRLEEVIAPTQYSNLSIMTGGSTTSDRPVPYNEDAMKALLGQVREQFDYVIFDGNSVFGSSEVVSFAKYFDAVILVVECEKTKWELIQMASEKIQKAGGNVLGVVLNKREYYVPDSIYRIMSKR